MIKNIFKLNGKPVNVASSWDDFTFEQYERVLNLKDNDITEVISIITDVPRETLESGEIIGLEKLLEVALFMKKVPAWDAVPNKIGGYTLPVNKNGQFDIQFESLGQFEDMRKAMLRCNTVVELTKTYSEFIAIYLQKIRDKEYSYSKALEMIQEVRKMPAREVMALGSFFYAKLRSLLNGTPNNSQNPPLSPKKSKPDSRTSMKGSARTRR